VSFIVIFGIFSFPIQHSRFLLSFYKADKTSDDNDDSDSKWSKSFDIWSHRRRALIVQSYSPGCANVNLHLTGCCSTDSERPHRCCHLPNKVENIDRKPDIPYTIQCSRSSPPPKKKNCPFRWKGSGPSNNTLFFGPPEFIP